MSLKLRRGTDAQRIGITPAEGELIYTTDTKKLYVGDGSIPGGIAVDTSGSGITDLVQDTTPQLGGNLDVNNFAITGSSIILRPTAGLIRLGDESGDGNIMAIKNSYSNSVTSSYSFAQHHETIDAVNFNFLRSRGNSATKTIVNNGDDIIDIGFAGWDGSKYVFNASINSFVDGPPALDQVPGTLRFFTNNGISNALVERLQINKDGVIKYNQLAALTGNDITVSTGTNILIGDIKLNQDGLSTINSNANLYLSANSSGRIYLDNIAWPASDGLNGQVLTTNGSGSLSWSTVSGGGSSFSRTTVVGSTSSIAVGVSENVNITGASKGYLLYKIQVNEPAWVRIYVSDSARTADSSRAEGVDPAPGSGVIAEVITSSTNQVVLISPGTIGFNNESTVDSTIFLRVTNKAYTTAITSTLTIVSLET